MTEKEYIEKLSKAAIAYYNTDSPILSDQEFDKLEEEFSKAFPESKYLSLIGAPVSTRKIKHKNKMLSLFKAKTFNDMMKWYKKTSVLSKSNYVVSYKLDGLSAKLTYENGVLTTLNTRGNGIFGQDRSYLIPYLDIPKTIETATDYEEITGELILPKSNGKYTEKLRNRASGILGSEKDLTDVPLLQFIAFDCPTSDFGEMVEVFDYLSSQGFSTAFYGVADNMVVVNTLYEAYSSSGRQDYAYETDGLVIMINNRIDHDTLNNTWVVDKYPHTAIAWKPEAESEETTLLDLEYNLSPYGRLIPKAIFEKISINGIDIEKATLDNAQNVLDQNLLIGDTIKVSRANDVIPHVDENLSLDSTRPIYLPTECPSCGEVLIFDGSHLVCKNTNSCPGQHLGKIVNFVKHLNPDGMGDKTVIALFEAGIISSIYDLLILERSDLVGADGFKEAKIAATIGAIESMRNITFPEFLDALSIPLVGLTALDNLGIKTYDDFKAFNDKQYVIGQNLITWRENNVDLVESLIPLITFKAPLTKQSKGSVVMTGTGPKPRKDLEALAFEKGYVLDSAVKKTTTYLITDDIYSDSSKCAKARKYGVKLITYEEFLCTEFI